jgi:hypothetical protein
MHLMSWNYVWLSSSYWETLWIGLFAFVLTLLWIFLLSPWVSVFQGVVERIFLLCLWAPKYRVLLFCFCNLCVFLLLSIHYGIHQLKMQACQLLYKYPPVITWNMLFVLPTIKKLPWVHKSFKQCKEDCYILVLGACFHRNQANANVIHVSFSFAEKIVFVSQTHYSFWVQ